MYCHFESDAAAYAIAGMWGVVGVTNDIAIKMRLTTTGVSDQIKKALRRSWFEPKNVQVTANGGMITLTGTVNRWQDRGLSGTTAGAAPDAISVENDIAVSL